MLTVKILRLALFVIIGALILIIPEQSNAAGVKPDCLKKFAYGQCTYYVAYVRQDLCEITDNPDFAGQWDAGNWANNFLSLYNAGDSQYLVDETPEVGAVVVFDWGHVGIVEEILSETNEIRISEVNYDYKGSFRDTEKYKISDDRIDGFIHTLPWSVEGETGLPYSLSDETKNITFTVGYFPLRQISVKYESDLLLYIDNQLVVAFSRPTNWTTSDTIIRWLWPGQHTAKIRYLRGTFTDGRQDQEPEFSQTWLGNSSVEAAEILPISYIVYAQPSFAKVGENVQISAGASTNGDASKISGINVSIDGKFLQKIAGASGNILWNTGGFSLGKHTITFRAEVKDYSGAVEEETTDYELTTGQIGTLTPPTLISPQQGEILNDRFVNFTWQSPNIPAQNGYTFRLSRYPNPDIIDPTLWEGGLGNEFLTYDYNFPADGIYYWHMRTWNISGQSGPWTSRQFTIDTFDKVTLCESEGEPMQGCWEFGGTGKIELTDINMNDKFKSLYVPPGMSVMLFRERDLTGTAECYSGNRIPLPIGAPWDLRGQVSSLQIFYQSDCKLSGLLSVIMYDDINFGHYYWGVGSNSGLYNLTQIGEYGDEYFRDHAESIKIPSGISVKLYDNFDGTGGSSACLTDDVPDLGSMKNIATSIEIFPSSDCSNEPSDSFELEPPKLLSPSDGAEIPFGTEIILDWEGVAGATEYQAHIQGPNGGDDKVSGWIKESQWNVGDLPSGTYDWLVEAKNEKYSTLSKPWQFTILESGAPPLPPENLSVIPISQSQINLEWTDASEDEDGFRVYRYRDGEIPKVITDTSANYTTLWDTGLPCGTDYWYYVTAFNSFGESSGTNKWRRFTFPCTPDLNSPSSGAVVDTQTPTFSWNQTGAYEKFQIQIGDSSNFASPLIDTEFSGSTSFSPSQALGYGKWYWRVRALGKNVNEDFTKMQDWSEWSPAWNFEIAVDDTPPNVEIVSHSDGDVIDTDNITIIADASDAQTGISGIYFFVGYDDGTGYDFQGLGWDTNGSDGWSKSWNASGVPDQTIRLQVYAEDNVGNEAWHWVDVVLDRQEPPPPEDETPPYVHITSPAEGSVINTNNITIQVEASDDQSGVDFIQFFAYYDDGSGYSHHFLGHDANGEDGWSLSWDASAVWDQQIILTVYAGDHAGNGDYHWVNVTLQREEPPPDTEVPPTEISLTTTPTPTDSEAPPTEIPPTPTPTPTDTEAAPTEVPPTTTPTPTETPP